MTVKSSCRRSIGCGCASKCGVFVEVSAIDLLLGISVSREVTSSHRAEVEDLGNGLAGLCAGLAKQRQDGAPINGVALYAIWESDARDWQIWQSWQGSE